MSIMATEEKTNQALISISILADSPYSNQVRAKTIPPHPFTTNLNPATFSSKSVYMSAPWSGDKTWVELTLTMEPSIA